MRLSGRAVAVDLLDPTGLGLARGETWEIPRLPCSAALSSVPVENRLRFDGLGLLVG